MKLLHVLAICLAAVLVPLLSVLLVRRLVVHTSRVTYTAEAFAESTDILANPYQGFYRIIGYTLSDDAIPEAELAFQTSSYTDPLVLLEINLKNYRAGRLSEDALAELDAILSAWSQSPSRTRMILRFLYDWDGTAFVTEPESLDIILTHMEQIAPAVNAHADSVYILQGIFTGNWGEMHHSRFTDDASVKTLIRRLNDVIAPPIYLSVRTPAQWRMISGLRELPAKFPALETGDTLPGRLGLFNDGLLGSESDLGTYGSTEKSDAAAPSVPRTRAEELAFQNELCRYVPNGGEVVYHPAFSALHSAVPALRTMHISYLNADYDRRVLDRWRGAVWTENDAFSGCDGYHYVQAHLGYRYVIQSCSVKRSGWIAPAYTLSLTLQNTGFSGALKPFQTSIVLKNVQSGACTRVPFPADLRLLHSGQKRSFSGELPVKDLEPGRYQVYFLVQDAASGQRILLGNTNPASEYGCLLGQLDK